MLSEPTDMRASRLVTLLLLLQTRGQLTAGELARELEVSVRTVLRDVDALSEAGVPIYAERGPHGGIRLVEGYRTRLTGMTGDEAEALFLSGLPGPAAELGLGTVVAAARLKVLAALPPELRARAARLVERFHLDASGWFQADEPVPQLPLLSQAVWEGRPLVIEYERGDQSVERRLEPLGLVLKAGVWYVVARVGDQMRTYRASRVVRAALLDERFERPDAFDLAAFWAESSSAYERDTPRIDVDVRIRPDRIGRLADAVGVRIVDQAIRLPGADPNGWTRLRLRIDWPSEVPHLLLRAGPDLEVIEPPEVRSRIAELARGVAANYPAPLTENATPAG
jgi:predicted DNA-binding transcriptional regulator YafY